MKKLFFFIVVFSCFALSSCKVLFPSYLFRDNQNFSYTAFIDSLKHQETVVSEGDMITFRLYLRNGHQLLDMFGSQIEGGTRLTKEISEEYLVRNDGYVEFPILGRIYVRGLTKFELADLLEQKFSYIYNEPYILLDVINRRVFVFMGLDKASVIKLPNENTNLLETIAIAGGISSGAKSSKVKLIRGDYENPTIKKIDLSTIDGLRDANIIMQPNDVLIFSPVIRVIPVVLRELTPILSLFTTIFTLFILFKRN